jgi:uncharacterized protein YjbI with pentapeptide repeats
MNKAETLALFAQGKEAWNEWAERMLAERRALEEKGEWSESVPRNDATKAWFDAARADFTGHSFTEEADFSGFGFPGEAGFGRANGKDEAGKDILVSTRFEKDAWFREATFSGEAQFDEAMFSRDAFFPEATFSEEAWFREATFSGYAAFTKATFSGNAVFTKASFLGYAQFDKATFSQRAWFTLARFESYTKFSDTSFKNAANFVAMRGESFFSLSGVTFHEAPDFEQAHFAEAPRLDASRYPDKAKPGETARWRALKRLAVQGHDHEREQFFFAQEIKSLRGATDWPLPHLQDRKIVWRNSARYWMGLFYQWCSDFGRSVVRPVFWWSGLATFAALFYFAQHNRNDDPTSPAGLIEWATKDSTPPRECVKGEASSRVASAIFLAFHKGSVAGLGGSDKLAQTYACLYGEERGAPLIPDVVAYAGMAQTLLSAPLIFLFLLAVRNHFRIK